MWLKCLEVDIPYSQHSMQSLECNTMDILFARNFECEISLGYRCIISYCFQHNPLYVLARNERSQTVSEICRDSLTTSLKYVTHSQGKILNRFLLNSACADKLGIGQYLQSFVCLCFITMNCAVSLELCDVSAEREDIQLRLSGVCVNLLAIHPCMVYLIFQRVLLVHTSRWLSLLTFPY